MKIRDLIRDLPRRFKWTSCVGVVLILSSFLKTDNLGFLMPNVLVWKFLSFAFFLGGLICLGLGLPAFAVKLLPEWFESEKKSSSAPKDEPTAAPVVEQKQPIAIATQLKEIAASLLNLRISWRTGSTPTTKAEATAPLAADQKQAMDIAAQLKMIVESLKDLHVWHYSVGMMGIILTGVGLRVAWIDSELHEQQKLANQESLVFDITRAFEDTFDLSSRRRFYRAYNLMTETNSSPAERAQLAEELAQDSNFVPADQAFLDLPRNRLLKTLIKPDLLLDYPRIDLDSSNEEAAAAIQTEMLNYRAVLMRYLNALDAFAILRDLELKEGNSDSPTLKLIEWTNIMDQTTGLMNFINAVATNRPHPQPGPWPTLVSDVNKMSWMP
jgi:hypothetical protein